MNSPARAIAAPRRGPALIVLDTNVLSEPLKMDPEESVLSWIATQDDMATTAVSVAELLTGARRLRPGRRRDELLVGIERVLGAFPASVLPYDEPAARRYAEMQESRRLSGVPHSVEDGMIAAICCLPVARVGHQAHQRLRGARGKPD